MIGHGALALLASQSYTAIPTGTAALDCQYDIASSADEAIVVLPGTNPHDPLDWIRDLRALPSWVRPLGLVHSGFGKGASALWFPLALTLPRDRLVTYTGHSLGGALAQGLAAIHADVWPDVPFRVVTFGAPRVAFCNPWFGRLVRRGVEAVEYQRAGDIVPDVPLRPFYRHPTRPRAIGVRAGNFVSNHAIARYAADLAALNL